MLVVDVGVKISLSAVVISTLISRSCLPVMIVRKTLSKLVLLQSEVDYRHSKCALRSRSQKGKSEIKPSKRRHQEPCKGLNPVRISQPRLQLLHGESKPNASPPCSQWTPPKHVSNVRERKRPVIAAQRRIRDARVICIGLRQILAGVFQSSGSSAHENQQL